MTLTSLKGKLIAAAAIVTAVSVILGGAYKVYSWIDNSVVSKEYLNTKIEEITKQIKESKKDSDISTNELSLMMIEGYLSTYHEKGLDNLTDAERHRYNRLLISEKANEEHRQLLHDY